MWFSSEQESLVSAEVQTLIQKRTVSLQETHQVGFISQFGNNLKTLNKFIWEELTLQDGRVSHGE